MKESSAATNTGMKDWLQFQHKELARERCNIDGVDRISELPDDILISIVSKLPLQEAAATSILSTRWRHLCSGSTRLIFPPFFPKKGPNYELLEEIQEEKFPRYINMINHTLDSYQHGLELKEFRVHMHCLRGATIERWLEFALSREIEIIDIQMRYLINARHGYYTLGLSDLIAKKDNLRQPLLGLNTLKELSLCCIHVEDREVELLLSKCPLLESLSIVRSKRLKNVAIIGGSSVNLKHLDISSSDYIESIEVRDMCSLVSLTLPSIDVLKLNNLPKLIELTISDHSYAQILNRIPWCIRKQLQILKLPTIFTFMDVEGEIPPLTNVKHLELEIEIDGSRTLHQIAPLLEACSSLEKIEIKFKWWMTINQKEFASRLWKWSPPKTWSRRFKTLKVSGYLGSPCELNLVSNIITNVVALKEIVVEPSDNRLKDYSDDEDAEAFLQMTTSRMWQQLCPITPVSAELTIMGLPIESAWRNASLFPVRMVSRFLHIPREKLYDASSLLCSYFSTFRFYFKVLCSKRFLRRVNVLAIKKFGDFKEAIFVLSTGRMNRFYNQDVQI